MHRMGWFLMNDCEPLTPFHAFQIQAALIILLSFGPFVIAAALIMEAI